MRTRGNKSQVLGLACCAMAYALALAPTTAAAQETVSSQPESGANGIKVGDGRLHPYFDLEFRFDSAAILDDVGLNPELIAHFRPGLRLEVPGNAVALNLNGNLDYVWYTGILASTGPSHLEGSVDLAAQFNNDGPVGVDISDHFARTDRTTNPGVGVGVISLYNQAKLGVPIRPGGRALEVTPSASYTLEFFDTLLSNVGCTGVGCTPAAFNYTNLGFELDARYKFLPKTAVVLDANFDIRTFKTGSPANLLKASAGIAGLLSSKISLLAKAGWAHNFSDVDAKTIIGHVELGWLASETASLKIGYLRSLEPIALFGIYGDDRGYIEGRALFGGKFSVRGYAAADFLTYYGGAGGNDTAVTFDLGPSYQFKPWLIAGVGYVQTYRTTARESNPALNYVRNEGYVRLTLTY